MDVGNLVEELWSLGYPILTISSFEKRHYSVWAYGEGKKAIRGQSSQALDLALKDIVRQAEKKKGEKQ